MHLINPTTDEVLAFALNYFNKLTERINERNFIALQLLLRDRILRRLIKQISRYILAGIEMAGKWLYILPPLTNPLVYVVN